MTTESHSRRADHAQVSANAGKSRRSRLRERSVMLNPAPLIGATLATFAIVFCGLTMRLATGHDPAVGGVAAVGRQAAHVGTGRVTTRASGTPVASGVGPQATGAGAPLVTATSGSAAVSRDQFAGGDDG
jgi:hypothetical protein